MTVIVKVRKGLVYYIVDILNIMGEPLETYKAIVDVFVNDVKLNLPRFGNILFEAKKVEKKGILTRTIFIYT